MSTSSVSKAMFASKRLFLLSPIFYWTDNGLAMINGATTPLQITEKPSFNTTASTKALMVCVCVARPLVMGGVLLDMRYQSLVYPPMTSSMP